MENEIVRWDKKSDEFKNEKFKGTSVAWKDMCFAGKGAELDQRTGVAACRVDGMPSYASAVTLFTDQYFDFLADPPLIAQCHYIAGEDPENEPAGGYTFTSLAACKK